MSNANDWNGGAWPGSTLVLPFGGILRLARGKFTQDLTTLVSGSPFWLFLVLEI